MLFRGVPSRTPPLETNLACVTGFVNRESFLATAGGSKWRGWGASLAIMRPIG